MLRSNSTLYYTVSLQSRSVLAEDWGSHRGCLTCGICYGGSRRIRQCYGRICQGVATKKSPCPVTRSFINEGHPRPEYQASFNQAIECYLPVALTRAGCSDRWEMRRELLRSRTVFTEICNTYVFNSHKIYSSSSALECILWQLNELIRR